MTVTLQPLERASERTTDRPASVDFAAVAAPINLRSATDADTLRRIRAGLDKYAVLVFRDQHFTDDEQLAFACRLDGQLHTKTGSAALQKSRFGNEALADISNVKDDRALRAPDDRARLYSLANRLWHTDASFQDPPGRYSLLHARVLPMPAPDTEFADMRGAYDALPDSLAPRLEELQVHHSIAYSRETLGFTFDEQEKERLEGAIHPLVRRFPNGRKSLYLASHASRIVGWTLPEGRLLLRDLIEHATQRAFVYSHAWQPNDLVIYDNRATMHRARPFDDLNARRELRRVTTLDLPFEIGEAAVSAA